MGSDQLAQGSDQLQLENLGEQKLHRLCEQPVPLLDCPHEEKALPCSLFLSEHLLFQLMPIAFHVATMHQCQESGSTSLIT